MKAPHSIPANFIKNGIFINKYIFWGKLHTEQGRKISDLSALDN